MPNPNIPYPQYVEEALGIEPAADYPGRGQRLTFPTRRWLDMVASDHISIPDGHPAAVNNHLNRLLAPAGQLHPIVEAPRRMSDRHIAHWKRLGLRTDSVGRPLHPYAGALLTKIGLGMYTGPGFYWRYGPQTVGTLGLWRLRDEVPEYAVIKTFSQRAVWSFPRRYTQPRETITAAALRAGGDKFSLDSTLVGHLSQTVSLHIQLPPSGGGRDTLHAWDDQWIVFAQQPAGEQLHLDANQAIGVVATSWMSLPHLRQAAFDKRLLRFINAHHRSLQ